MRYKIPGFYREVAILKKQTLAPDNETDKTENYVYEDIGKSFKFKYLNRTGDITTEARLLASFPYASSFVKIATNTELEFKNNDRVVIAGQNSLIKGIERMPDATRLRGIKKKREVKILWLT